VASFRGYSSDLALFPRSSHLVMSHFEQLYPLSSFSDARERSKESFRNRNPCDACQHTCRRKRRTHATPQASRFLSARIAPFAQHRRFRAHQPSIVRVTLKSSGARGEGFNRRGSISVLHFNAPDRTPLGAPKLSACAAGIESVHYDLDRFLPLQKKAGCRKAAFGYFSRIY
jgi:hypothetical protein